jgi:uncharacterized protein YlbG (UPF0298 family)
VLTLFGVAILTANIQPKNPTVQHASVVDLSALVSQATLAQPPAPAFTEFNKMVVFTRRNPDKVVLYVQNQMNQTQADLNLIQSRVLKSISGDELTELAQEFKERAERNRLDPTHPIMVAIENELNN